MTGRKPTKSDQSAERYNERAAAAWSALLKVRKPQKMRTDSWAMAHLVAHYLCWWNRFDEIYPSQDKIAADLGIPRTAVQRALDNAERAGLIEREYWTNRHGKWTGTSYRLAFLGIEVSATAAPVGTSLSDEAPSSPLPASRSTEGPESNICRGPANGHLCGPANGQQDARLTGTSDSPLRGEEVTVLSFGENDDDDRAAPDPSSSSSRSSEEEDRDGNEARPDPGADPGSAPAPEGGPGLPDRPADEPAVVHMLGAQPPGGGSGPPSPSDDRARGARATPTTGATPQRKANLYTGPCTVCGETVYVGEGHLSGKDPIHPDCEKSPSVLAAEQRTVRQAAAAAAAAEAQASADRLAAIAANPTRDELEDLTPAELRTVAQTNGHEIPPRMKAVEIVAVVLGEVPDTGIPRQGETEHDDDR